MIFRKLFAAAVLCGLLVILCLITVQASDADVYDGYVETEITDHEEEHGGLYEEPDSLLKSFMGIGDDAGVVSIDPLYSSDYNGNKLWGLTRQVYESVKDMVIQTAWGNNVNTQIQVDFTEDDLAGYYWYAQDLGVNSLYGDEYETSVNTYAARVAVDYLLDTNRAMKSVIRDCPYELFWFSNKYTISRHYVPYVRKDPYTGEPYMGLKSVTVNLGLGVSPDYMDYNWPDGYTVSWNKIVSIQNALENANNIVYNAGWMTDREKLDYFMQQICYYASYDYDVSTSTYPGGYGDPWQIIYVFDGDPQTGVVCEGYAKAFQYLCDQSSLSYGTYVYCAAGELQIGSGPTEGHLWNIVHTGGQNYLVDLTNCDANGFSTDLYLALPVSGSVDEGYTFLKGERLYSYYYSYDTRLIYNESELYMFVSGQYNGEDDGQIVLERELSYGMYGSDVLAVQEKLYELGYMSAYPDGAFGMLTEEAVNEFQLANGLGYSTGVVGSWTLDRLNHDPVPYGGSWDQDYSQDTYEEDPPMVLYRELSYGSYGEDVLAVQQMLYDKGYLFDWPDGAFGLYTQEAVIRFQEDNLIYADGIVGNATFEALQR